MTSLGATEVLNVQRAFWKAMVTVTGPNDARHVVWALGEFFILCSFLILNDIYSMEGSPRASSKVTRMIMGPNSAKCVVWAHGEYFFFSLCLFNTNMICL